jgi:hypothetical protein
MSQPSRDELASALGEAGAVHHDYEQNALGGNRDEMWPGFYAAFVLGRPGNFVAASRLSALLAEAPASEHWARSTADYVLWNAG